VSRSADAVYLDHAASTPLRAEVREAMLDAMARHAGNPSSAHAFGRAARAALDDARARLAAVIGGEPGEIVFTRGGTEADNLAVAGRAGAAPGRPLAVSAVEHRAVLATAAAVAHASGVPLRVLPVDGCGVVSLEAVDEALAERPAVMAVMWANNEVGAVQPVEEIAARCRDAGVAFHADAVQALGKLPVRADRVAADLLAFSAHKFGGPRGGGALYVRRGTRLAPLLHGGGQERGLRAGTEDVASSVGLAVAAELAEGEREGEMRRLGALRDGLEAALRAAVPELRVHAEGAPRLPTILSVSVAGVDGEMLMMGLDLEGLAVSAGSACSSGSLARSHVLTAMGLGAEDGPAARFSLGRESTEADVARAAAAFPALVARLRAMATA
jgi:cysteine desulfurase